ncbi:MAG: cofactor-independent phosphoglycerate mutase [Candidatus Ratteibacteria bacterium]
MKYILLIPDGAADWPIPQLHGKTPLQTASTPAMDHLALQGRCGLYHSIPPGCPAGSDVANLSILGYDPATEYQGRAVFEAASLGIPLSPEDVVLRCNTISIENNRIKNHSSGHISSEEAHELLQAVSSSLTNSPITLHPGFGYRHILTLKGDFSTDFDASPPHDHVGKAVDSLLLKGKSAPGKKTADFLNRFMLHTRTILEKHPVNLRRIAKKEDPANMLWLWSPGRKPSVIPFFEKTRMKGAVISAVDLIKGIAICAEMDVINVPGATGLYTTNYEGKADACIEALHTYDFLYVHVEASDEASHEGNLPLKLQCIEYFDQRLLDRILSQISLSETRIAILPDHYTPIKTKGHTSDPVPFLIAGSGVEPDRVSTFDEPSCSKGGYGTLQGDSLLQTLFSK